jgi:hypothetical protein
MCVLLWCGGVGVKPAEFPPVPIIARETNGLTNASWKIIADKEFDDPDAASGKVKGACVQG